METVRSKLWERGTSLAVVGIAPWKSAGPWRMSKPCRHLALLLLATKGDVMSWRGVFQALCTVAIN